MQPHINRRCIHSSDSLDRRSIISLFLQTISIALAKELLNDALGMSRVEECFKSKKCFSSGHGSIMTLRLSPNGKFYKPLLYWIHDTLQASIWHTEGKDQWVVYHNRRVLTTQYDVLLVIYTLRWTANYIGSKAAHVLDILIDELSVLQV